MPQPFKEIAQWLAIGILSGIVLAGFLFPAQWLWDVKAYNLLFDVSYIPGLNTLEPRWLARAAFHFGTCICSLTMLYYLLCDVGKEMQLRAYILVVGIGSSALYFLTLLGEDTPPITDALSWVLWTVGHVLFSVTGWFLIVRWIGEGPADARSPETKRAPKVRAHTPHRVPSQMRTAPARHASMDTAPLQTPDSTDTPTNTAPRQRDVS